MYDPNYDRITWDVQSLLLRLSQIRVSDIAIVFFDLFDETRLDWVVFA